MRHEEEFQALCDASASFNPHFTNEQFFAACVAWLNTTHMKTVTYDIVIDSISSPFGHYPGTVEVHHHCEGGDLDHGQRDGFAVSRVCLPSEAIKKDGTYDDDAIYTAVRAALGEQDSVEKEEAE